MITFLISFLTYTVYKYRKNEFSHIEKLQTIKLEYENSLLEVQLEIQEQTLEHLAKEIHDNCNQKLSLAKLHLNTLELPEHSFIQEQAQTAIEIITTVIQDLSDLSHSMSSEILNQNGLVSALKKEISQLQKLNVFDLKLILNGDEPIIDNKKELIIFRIAQEAIHNILKHSKASLVEISLHFTDKEVSLQVSDNGVGFSLDSNEIKGIGLKNMAERTRLLNGEFHIDSSPFKGTFITSKIPV
jgi:two-component system, NarL family, sensor kinase